MTNSDRSLTAKVIDDGDGQIIVFPEGFPDIGDRVKIARVDGRLVLTPIWTGGSEGEAKECEEDAPA